MTGALIILSVTILVGLILYLTHRPDETRVDPSPAPDSRGESEECCGVHAVCEKGLTPLSEPEYFDDEELDRFAGRHPDEFTPAEEEEFREVLYTLLPSDVYAWGVSLTMRDIALPYSLRDEWLMLAGDAAALPSSASSRTVQ